MHNYNAEDAHLGGRRSSNCLAGTTITIRTGATTTSGSGSTAATSTTHATTATLVGRGLGVVRAWSSRCWGIAAAAGAGWWWWIMIRTTTVGGTSSSALVQQLAVGGAAAGWLVRGRVSHSLPPQRARGHDQLLVLGGGSGGGGCWAPAVVAACCVARGCRLPGGVVIRTSKFEVL